MNTVTRTLVLAVVIIFGHLGYVPFAYAITITISVAEVRGNMAFVKGSGAGRKQEIFWENDYVTKANGKGNFSFEGALPMVCTPDNCDGLLTAGDAVITVPLAYQPDEPPVQPEDELDLIVGLPAAHDGDSIRAVGIVANGPGVVRVVSGGADTNLRYWDLELTQDVDLVLDVDHDHDLPNIIYDIDVWTDETKTVSLLASSEGGWKGHAGSETLRTWDGSGVSLKKTQAPIGFVYAVAISPDRIWTIVSGFYGDLVLYQTHDLEIYSTTATKKKRTQALDFSHNGLVASASSGGIHLWSFPENCIIGTCELDPFLSLSHSGSWSFSVAFAPASDSTLDYSDRVEMVSGTDSGKTKFWSIDNIAMNPTVSVRSIDSGAVYALAWSPDGSRIVAGEGGDITVYDATDLANPKILFRNVGAHDGRVNDVAFSPDSSMIVSGGADGALKLWMYPEQ